MQHIEFIFKAITHYNQTYAAIVSLPDDYDENRTQKYPVFFLFHGDGQISSGGYTSSGLLKESWNLWARLESEELEWTDCIFVQPQMPGGSGGSWSLLFLQEFIEVILGIREVPGGQPSVGIGGIGIGGYHSYNIDKNRIYLAGISRGGEAITKLVDNNIADFFCCVIHIAAINNVILTAEQASKVRYFIGHHKINDPAVFVTAIDRWINAFASAVNTVRTVIRRLAGDDHSGWVEELANTDSDAIDSIYTFPLSTSRLDFTNIDANTGLPVPDPDPETPAIFELFNSREIIDLIHSQVKGRISPHPNDIANILEAMVKVKPTILTIEGEQEYTVVWDDVKISAYGDHAKFEVWQNGEINHMPVIQRSVNGENKPTSYTFILDNITTEIHIK
jgi:hypothetical protein